MSLLKNASDVRLPKTHRSRMPQERLVAVRRPQSIPEFVPETGVAGVFQQAPRKRLRGILDEKNPGCPNTPPRTYRKQTFRERTAFSGRSPPKVDMSGLGTGPWVRRSS